LPNVGTPSASSPAPHALSAMPSTRADIPTQGVLRRTALGWTLCWIGFRFCRGAALHVISRRFPFSQTRSNPLTGAESLILGRDLLDRAQAYREFALVSAHGPCPPARR
jgi:hypothetical protein